PDGGAAAGAETGAGRGERGYPPQDERTRATAASTASFVGLAVLEHTPVTTCNPFSNPKAVLVSAQPAGIAHGDRACEIVAVRGGVRTGAAAGARRSSSGLTVAIPPQGHSGRDRERRETP